MASPLVTLRRLIAERQLDAAFISNPTNRRYLSGFTGSAGFLIITQDDAVLATDFRYIEQARAQAPGFEVLRIAGEPARWLPSLVQRLSLRAIGIESDDLTLSAHAQLVGAAQRLPPKARPRLVRTRDLVEPIRAIKHSAEARAIERAARLADAAIARANELLQPGMTEIRLAWELEKFFRENGSQSLPFPIIVASGPNAARPHAEPGDRVIRAGEPVVIDLGARLDGYSSDLTRTLCLGEPGETLLKIHGIVRRAQAGAIEGLRPGMSGEEADRVAREIIAAEGYGEAFGHGLGHGVGLEVHEQPRLGPGSDDTLAKGMVFTIEPGIYLEGWGGVRIEDMVLLEENRPRLLTQARTLED